MRDQLALNLKIVFFIVLWGASLAIVLSAVTIGGYYILKFILALIALTLDVLAFSTRFYTYLYEPFIRMKHRQVILDDEDPYTISPSGSAILVREGQSIYATSFIKIPIYVSATEMENEDKALFAGMFARVISLSQQPVKLTSQLYVLNKDQYMESVRKKLNEAEDRYNTVLNKQLTEGKNAKDNEQSSMAERVRGEVTMWRNVLDSVGKAKSHALITYASVSALGSTEDEATNLAMARADELAAGISAVLGVTATVASGSELQYFIDPDYMIPVTNVSERLREKSIDKGI